MPQSHTRKSAHAHANLTDLETEVAGIKTDYALGTHNHDLDYAGLNHNHDTDYAQLSHNHDTIYAPLTHTHTISNIIGLQAALDAKTDTGHTHSINNIVNLQTALDQKINSSNIGLSNGIASLDANGLVPASQLPSYVDDVKEFATFNNLPTSGETGKIYVTTDTNKIYRWSGTTYIEISSQVSTADAALKLATARQILLTGDVSGSVSFDGSANVEISTTIADDSHNHIVSDIDGLQAALDGKSSTSHDHSGVYQPVGSYAAAVHNHDSDYAALSHVHAISSITGLQTALDGKSATSHNHDTDYAALNHTHTIANVTGLQTALDGKASTSHNHDTDYAQLGHNHDNDYADINHNHDSDYAALSHTHTIANVTGLQTALDGKAASSHNHDSDYAALSHNHDTDYAGINHNHDSDYAASNHHHDSVYQAAGSYAAATHNHDSDYADINHNHDSDYAAANHNHDANYAGISHSHSDATSSASGFMSASDKSKLAAIEASADVTDTANVVGALTAGTAIDIASDGTVSHEAGTLSAGQHGNGNNIEKIDYIELDAEGHVVGVTVGSSETWHRIMDDNDAHRSLNDYQYLKFEGGQGIDVDWASTGDGSSNTSPLKLTITHSDTSSQAGVTGSTNNVIQTVGLDAFGHVTNLATTQITPTLIGAAASSHNHDGTYLKDLVDDATPQLGGNLDANSKSITGITNLSANSLVLASGGTLVSSANWSQGGTASFSGDVTTTGKLDVEGNFKAIGTDFDVLAKFGVVGEAAFSDLGTHGVQINTSDSSTDAAKIKFTDSGNSMSATIGLNSTNSRQFDIIVPPRTGTTSVTLMDRDTGGNFNIYSATDGIKSRLSHNNIWQFGSVGLHNGSDLLDGSREGWQVNGNSGQTVQSSTNSTVSKLGYTGTSSPTMVQFYLNGTASGGISLSSSGGVTYSTSSDARMKENIKDLTGSLDRVLTLQPKSFSYKSGNGSITRGLIAQDVEQLEEFSENFVSTPEGDEQDESPMKSIDYSKFVPDLIGAIQELQKQIEHLKSLVK